MKDKRYSSVQHALSGIAFLCRREPHARFEFAVAFVVVVLGVILRLNRLEWGLIVFAIVSVLALEGLNSIVEHLLDVFRPRLEPQVRVVKDMLAAVVFIAALGSVAIGFLIFIPAFLRLFVL